MAKPKGRGARVAQKPRVAKRPKTYRLSEAKIAAAQKVLGADTATATIDEALDMILFRKELIEGTRKMFGMRIKNVFK